MSPRQVGFTLVELVVTMIVIGIMAFVALPRFSGIGAFDARGYADQIESYLRFAQKSALAQRRMVLAVISSDSTVQPVLCIAATATDPCPASCSAPGNLAHPAAASFRSGRGTSLTAASVCFDRLGGTGATQQIEVRDNTNSLVRTIRIERVTGYVHSF